MTRTLLAALAVLVLAAPAAQAADHTITVDDATKSGKITGKPAIGLNTSYFEETAAPGGCGNTPQNHCETTLVKVGPETTKKSLTFRMDNIDETSDFDLRVYTADASGNKAEYLGSPTGEGNGPTGLATFFGDYETKTVTGVKPNAQYLVEIVYFTVVNDTYDLSATLK